MADINSAFPVSGTSMPAWTGVGSTRADVLGSVAITSSTVLGVSGIDLAGSVAITSSAQLSVLGSVAITRGDWAGVGSVLVTNTVNTSPGGIAGSFIYNTTAAVASAASGDHFYTPAANANVQVIDVSATGRVKAVWGYGSPAMTDQAGVMFNSTANPNVRFEVKQQVAASTIMHVRIVNLEGAAQDVYSTIYSTY
jgi:hypothetical protein